METVGEGIRWRLFEKESGEDCWGGNQVETVVGEKCVLVW